VIVSDRTFAYPIAKCILPDSGGVYMFYAWSRLLYIGRTWRFSQRLPRHEKFTLAEQFGLTHIRFIETSDDPTNPHGFTAKLERQLIKESDTPLNGHYRRTAY
jgi:predicted GIY-YIG superfamily endonuclease